MENGLLDVLHVTSLYEGQSLSRGQTQIHRARCADSSDWSTHSSQKGQTTHRATGRCRGHQDTELQGQRAGWRSLRAGAGGQGETANGMVLFVVLAGRHRKSTRRCRAARWETGRCRLRAFYHNFKNGWEAGGRVAQAEAGARQEGEPTPEQSCPGGKRVLGSIF